LLNPRSPSADTQGMPSRRRSARRALLASAALPLVLIAACTDPPPAAPPAPPAPAATSTWTTVRAGTGPGYGIALRFHADSLTDVQRNQVIAAFRSAAERWERVITADLPDVDVSNPNSSCFLGGPVTRIDDLHIDATVTTVGFSPGSATLGSAGFCVSPGSLPRAGQMRFNAYRIGEMLANGSFERVVLHEMGHVLGIGTMWSSTGYLDQSIGGDPRFTGPNAVAEWNALSDGHDTGVPVETGGGSGTALKHWRESELDTELMTGWIDLPSSPLSRVSIASLADLGYQVDLSQADPFTVGGSLLAMLRTAGAPDEVHDHLDYDLPAAALELR
jgi:hypothetical protein